MIDLDQSNGEFLMRNHPHSDPAARTARRARTAAPTGVDNGASAAIAVIGISVFGMLAWAFVAALTGTY